MQSVCGPGTNISKFATLRAETPQDILRSPFVDECHIQVGKQPSNNHNNNGTQSHICYSLARHPNLPGLAYRCCMRRGKLTFMKSSARLMAHCTPHNAHVISVFVRNNLNSLSSSFDTGLVVTAAVRTHVSLF